MTELKPRPFCGAKPALVVLSSCSYVRCRHFCCEQGLTFKTKEDAIEAWNERAEDGKRKKIRLLQACKAK